VLAAVLTREVDWSLLPKRIPHTTRQLIARCLDRDPRHRLRDIGEAREAIERGGAAEAASDPGAGSRSGTSRLPWAIAALSTLTALTLWLNARPAPTLSPTVRFDLSWPGDAARSASTDSNYFELSPDGRYLAIVAAGQIWVRPLDSQTARPVAGTEGGTYPFWSPDGNSIGFFAANELRRISRDGGTAQKLCDAPVGRGGAWSTTGTIVFSQSGSAEGLSRVGDRGGSPTRLPRLTSPGGTSSHRYPQFLPDGHHFIFTLLVGSKDLAGIYVGDLDGTPPVRVLDGSDHAAFAAGVTPTSPGHLLFRRREVLMAQPFDPARLRVTGDMFPVAERVGLGGNTGHGAFAVSATGVLAYSELSVEREVLTWLDRSGRRIGAVTGKLGLGGFAISPDERTLAYAAGPSVGGRDIWLQPMSGGSPSRFTFAEDGTGWTQPHWSSDGARIVLSTQNNAGAPRYEIRTRRIDRTGPDEILTHDTDIVRPWDSTPDGRMIVYSARTDTDLLLLPLGDKARPVSVTNASDRARCAQFSPDGRFIAYAVGPLDSSEIVVQPIPTTGALWQVSTQGGAMPRWRADGREIYYRASDGKLMAVSVRAGAASFESGTPQPLFEGIPPPSSNTFCTYQPARDGQRFLVSLIDANSQSPITIVVNWEEAVHR